MRVSKKLLWPLLVIAGVLRVVLLNGSFWMDEAAQVFESGRSFSEQFQIPYDFQPPLFHVLIHAMYQFSTAEVWLRMIPFLAGILSIYLIYFLVEEKLHAMPSNQSTKIALIASSLMAVSSFHVYFSQELRPYSLACLWAICSWYALLKLERKNRGSWWLVYTFANIAGLYTMYVYPFLLIGQCIWVLIVQRHLFNGVLKSFLFTGIAFLPWLPSFLEQLRIGSELRSQLPGWSDIVSTPVWKALPMILAKFTGGVLPVDANIQTMIGVILPLALSALMLLFGFRQKSKLGREVAWLVCAWLIIPLASAQLLSIFLPVLSPKRVLFTFPAWALALSFAVFQIKKNWKWWLLGSFVATQCFGLFVYWGNPTVQRERWKEVSIQIHEQFSPENTIIVLGWSESIPSWQLYANQQEKPIRVLPVASVRTVIESELDDRMKPVEEYTNVLVFDYMRDLTDPKRSIESWLETHGYKGIDSIDTKNFGFIRYYVRQPMLGLGESQMCQKHRSLRVGS